MNKLILAFTVALAACNSGPEPAERIMTADSVQQTPAASDTLVSSQAPPPGDPPAVIVDDPSQYSIVFLEGIARCTGRKKIQLKGDRVIFDSKDTAVLPTGLPLNERETFAGRKGDTLVGLHLRRLNYTTLEYKLECMFGKTSFTENGVVDLSDPCFLGTESDYDDATGLSYAADEYTSEKEGCFVSVRVGLTDEKLLAVKVIRNCKDGKNIALEDCPTLYPK